MIVDIAILVACVIVAGILIWPRVAKSRLWRATLTPLASIIGSGFLVLGPILSGRFGRYAALVMALLCGLAALFGFAIRYNIAERVFGDGPQRLEKMASWALAFAYVISVAYYLNLFGAFALSLTSSHGDWGPRMLTTGMFLLVLVVGVTRGFSALERVEQLAVGVKLSIIAGLIVGLAIRFGGAAEAHSLDFGDPSLSGFAAVQLVLGLVVTVQGFETSRYLGEEYTPDERRRSMRLAQIISSAIYLVYIGLMAPLFDTHAIDVSETAIVQMMGVVAPILPTLLVAAALSAQLSAALADTGGAGGLVHELTGGRFPERYSYVLLVGLGIALTWFANVFEIISYASRAFALYYALQSSIAAWYAWKRHSPARSVFFVLLALLGLAVTVLGAPVDG